MRSLTRSSRRIAPLLSCAERIHLLDWITVIVVFVFIGTLSLWVTPATRPFALPESLFSSDSSSSSQPIAAPGIPILIPNPVPTSRVPNSVLLSVSMGAPIIIIIFTTLLLLPFPPTASTSPALHYRPRFRVLNLTLLGFLTTLSLTLLLTETLKNIVGKQRPDFWGRCGGIVDDETLRAKYTIDTRAPPGVRMVTWEICANYYTADSPALHQRLAEAHGDVESGELRRISRAELRDGWRSFPSGHASMAFAGLGYLSLFIGRAVGVLRMFGRDKLRRRRAGLARLVVTMAPVVGAGYIAATRYGDLKHYGADICTGAMLGVLGAALGFGWYLSEVERCEEEARLAIVERESGEDDGVGEINEDAVAETGKGRVAVTMKASGSRDVSDVLR